MEIHSAMNNAFCPPKSHRYGSDIDRRSLELTAATLEITSCFELVDIFVDAFVPGWWSWAGKKARDAAP